MHPIQSALSLLHNGFFIIVGLCGIGFLIGFHELGHFLFAKLFSIRTPSFSIGMGPRLLTKKIGQTEFSLSAIPLGGYVEVAGLGEVGQGDQKEAGARDSGSFVAKPYYQKFLVMIGGILFNLMFAYCALALLYAIGMPISPLLYPHNATTTIKTVHSDGPAANLLQDNDTIIAINDQNVTNASAIIEIIRANPNQELKLEIERDGAQRALNIRPGQKEVANKTIGFLGIDFVIPRYGLLGAIQHGFNDTNFMIGAIFNSFKAILSGQQLDNLGGPVMVISQTIKGAAHGFRFFLLLLAFISINLAVLNLIPLPIFDGGQILYFTIEALIRRPLPNWIREYVHYATWIGVIILAIYLSIKDILKLL